MKPLQDEIINLGHEYIWYVPNSLVDNFPFKNSNFTDKIQNIKSYKSDIIFVPGNEVPHFLRGLKVQIFHGLAGEKKGHFRIRDYFDLYLTQGSYFTKRFQELSKKHKNFDVIETGWCKLDTLYTVSDSTKENKQKLLTKYNVKNIILYAPTFSPSLTSGNTLVNTIKQLSENEDILVIIKFHDKMDNDIIEKYKNLNTKNLIISNEKDITPLLQISDLMISDTSSVVYEFVLLNKPVVTLNSTSENINWEDVKNTKEVSNKVLSIIGGNDRYIELREKTINQYHPYNDGNSACRMIDASINYVQEHGVPNKKNLPWHRKIKINNKYGWFV
jgi:hypothetical protein